MNQLIEGDQTYLKAYVKGRKVCDAYFAVFTTYDLATKGEDAECYWIDICQLDTKEGQVVYVTPTGEKYHFSKECAGENAQKTTYKDVLAYEYQPCGKCVE